MCVGWHGDLNDFPGEWDITAEWPLTLETRRSDPKGSIRLVAAIRLSMWIVGEVRKRLFTHER